MTVLDAYQALSDPSRRRILQLLGEDDLSAGQIAAEFEMSWPSVSRHLGVLKSAGLVKSSKNGSSVVYSLGAEALTNVLRDLGQLASRRSSKRYRVVLGTVGLRSGEGAPHKRLLDALPYERFEVVLIPSPRYRSAEETAEALLLENPDVIGVIDNHGAAALVPHVVRLLREGGLYDVPVFAAGSIPLEEIPKLKQAGIGACLIEDFSKEAFVNWVDSALSAGGALQLLEQETKETYALGGNLASGLYWDFNQNLADKRRAIKELISKNAGPDTKVEVTYDDGGLDVSVHTDEAGRLIGKSGSKLDALVAAIGELTGMKVNVNVLTDVKKKARSRSGSPASPRAGV